MGGWVGGWVGMSGADGMQESWKSGRLFGWVGKKDANKIQVMYFGKQNNQDFFKYL